jgi:hypothetical protein
MIKIDSQTLEYLNKRTSTVIVGLEVNPSYGG